MMNKNKRNVCAYGCCKYYQKATHVYRASEKRAAERQIREERTR